MLSEKELIHIITHPESASMHRVHLVAKELLSLREQLAELKALPPVAWTDAEELRFPHATSDIWPSPLGFYRDIPLFTAAKPEALPRHIYSMLVNELRDVPAIGCKRELIVGVLNRHGVIAEPVGG